MIQLMTRVLASDMTTVTVLPAVAKWLIWQGTEVEWAVIRGVWEAAIWAAKADETMSRASR